MPEGHTIHRLARDHRNAFLGQRLECSSPQGRFEEEAAWLHGRCLTHIDAYGKHLFYEFDQQRWVHVHLGLYGKFRRQRVPLPEPRGAVRWRVCGTSSGFDLNGPNRCELIDPAARQRILDRLGEDPLRDDCDPERVWQRVSRSRAPLGTLLLNQAVFAGVGNIFRTEVLFVVGLSPELPGRQLSRHDFDALWQYLVEWMRRGVKYNRIITVDRESSQRTWSRLRRDERLRIYKKPQCPVCETTVEWWEQAARKIYACPNCQSLAS